MNPVRTAHTDTVLGTPLAPLAEGHCDGLPIRAAEGASHSYWQPSPTEWLRILRGQPIRLTVYGVGHPAVSLDMED